jgi:hypothetical protein
MRLVESGGFELAKLAATEVQARAIGKSTQEDEARAWPRPTPLPGGLPPVQPFALDLVPAVLRNFVQDASERMQCPADYVAKCGCWRQGGDAPQAVR